MICSATTEQIFFPLKKVLQTPLIPQPFPAAVSRSMSAARVWNNGVAKRKESAREGLTGIGIF
jgi:hypothetical protein